MMQGYLVSNCVSFQIVYHMGIVLLQKALCTFGLVVMEGDRVTLLCTMNEGIYPRWTGPDFMGNTIPYSYLQFPILNHNLGEKSSRLTWDIQNNNSLIIQNIRMNDSGVYTCSNRTHILETYNVSVREDKHTERTTNVALIAGPFCGFVAVILCITVVVVVCKRRSTDNTRRSTSLNSDTIQSPESVRPTAGTDMAPRRGYNYSVNSHVYAEIMDYESLSTGNYAFGAQTNAHVYPGTDMAPRRGYNYSVNSHVYAEIMDYESLSTGNKTTTSSEITYGNLQI